MLFEQPFYRGQVGHSKYIKKCRSWHKNQRETK